MQYFKVCKYDYDNPDYMSDWMLGSELLKAGQSHYPEEYYIVEQQFLEVVSNFFEYFNEGEFNTHHLKFFLDDDDFNSPDEKVAAFSNLLPNIDLPYLVDKEFNTLSNIEKVYIYQLSLRDVVQVGVKDVKTGACFSDMSDGFYWFLALPDDVPIDEIVKPQKGVYVYDWYDIWSDE
ncbi:hypothetical protein ORJ00_05265 [Rheinheimera baltica]|uniref:hypothetical protein n=1 Tax=Rheinheimera baltica TaxID=67576 RepID=UPI0003FFB446|nr:hypothetical protein [Rheinheimera baltica]MDP5142143.1 hypothetical protein [Rheinheimera baltica]